MKRPRPASEAINLYEAKTHLSELVDRAAAGEVITIAKAGRPLARLVPWIDERPVRTPGALAGKVWIAGGFDDELPETYLLGDHAPTPAAKPRGKPSAR
jgi:prevent-host-death family protein